jgi:hypothetical protein
VECLQTKDTEEKNNSASYDHLCNNHRKIIDSIHQTSIGSQVTVYKVVLEARSNALLMSEDTMNFYQYNLEVKPNDTSHLAMSYLMKILNILLKWNKDVYKETSKQLKKAA